MFTEKYNNATPRGLAASVVSSLILFALLIVPVRLQAQTREKFSGPRGSVIAPATAATPQSQIKYRGVWEPVSYQEDLKLFDVFFATADEGWVAGGRGEISGGVILHTRDGGTHWENQYGDPGSSDGGVSRIRFLDATHGWATQSTGGAEARLLHTRDGKNWIPSGTIPTHARDYMFTSETNGAVIDGGRLLQTTDGGRRWIPVNQCEVSVQVEGLARRVSCTWTRIQFLTPAVGYAAGFSVVGRGTGPVARIVVLGKTKDGGATWALTTGEVTDDTEDAFFIDENTGYVRTGYGDTGQLFKTNDGGQTWTGMAASPGDRLQFADPEVGWSLHYNKVSFTTDGGNRWNSREYPFPAHVETFSLPRRDRGYIVGDHGMIYRYRIVPIEHSAKGMIPAPLLSGIDSPLDAQVQQLAQQVQQLAKDVGAPPVDFTQDTSAVGTSPNPGMNAAGSAVSFNAGGTMAGGAFAGAIPGCPAVGLPGAPVSFGSSGQSSTTYTAGSTNASPMTSSGSFSQDTSSANTAGVLPAQSGGSGAFVQDTSAASATLTSVSTTVPQFVTKYRNLNLMLTGFQVATQMPATVQCMAQSFQALKNGKNPQAAMAAVMNIQGQMVGLMQLVRTGFQKPH